MSATVSEILKLAAKEIGVKESPANSNRQKYGAAYGLNGYPWCVMFVWWLFQQAKAAELFYGGGKCASCSALRTYAKQKNQWVTSGYKAGDLVIFDFPNTKAVTDHIGIVEGVNGSALTTIEGNTSPDDSGDQANGGMVCRKKRHVSLVVGAYRPKYDSETKITSVAKTVSVALPQLEIGATGDSVTAMQVLLNWHGAKLDADGDFGAKTKTALKNYQSEHKSECGGADGICGAKTWTSLLT